MAVSAKRWRTDKVHIWPNRNYWGKSIWRASFGIWAAPGATPKEAFNEVTKLAGDIYRNLEVCYGPDHPDHPGDESGQSDRP